ncbi:hypothetical protein O8C83_02600 [Aliarcobacter butzleri]|nr:hypothetical protein [Aliarcobacter butzleri]
MKYTILKGNLKIKELINNESIIGNKITIYGLILKKICNDINIIESIINIQSGEYNRSVLGFFKILLIEFFLIFSYLEYL